MSKSYIIKKNLLSEFVQSIDSLIKKPGTITFSPEVRKGYASAFLSVVNYGFNVANRRELPTTDETYLNTETSLPLGVDNLDWEERYSRNETTHPSRHILKEVEQALISLSADQSAVDIITQHFEDKHQLGDLGKLKTPEEILGEVFVKLDSEKMLAVCLQLANKHLTALDMTIPDQKHKSIGQKTVVKLDSKYESNFKLMMDERLARVQQVDSKLKEKFTKILPYEAPQTKYPCMIFCVRDIAKRVECDPKPTLFPSDRYTSLNKCIMSYFCGLVNSYSRQYYGENFIYVQPIVSFGSLRPTICASGRTFRFSLGVVPENFDEVIYAAYKEMVEVLEDKDGEVVKNLRRLFHYDSQAKMDEFFHSQTANETCQLTVFGLHTQSASAQDLFIQYLNTIEKFSLDPKGILEQRKNNFNSGLEYKSESSKPKFFPESPPVLLGLLQQLIEVAKLRIDSFERNYSLSSFDKIVKKELILAVEDALNAENSYNKTVSAIETLTRLLKLDYELEIVYEDECRSHLQKSEFELPISPKLERSLSTSSEDAYPMRSGMDTVTEFLSVYGAQEKKSEVISTDELYFEFNQGLIKKIGQLDSKVAKLSLADITKGMQSIHFADVRAFPKKPIGQSKATDWDRIFNNKENIPEILLVDITSATLEDIQTLHKRFNENEQAPHLLIMFSSDNKFAQIGVDLVCMGEIRVYYKKFPTHAPAEKNITELYEKLKEVLKEAVPLNPVSARAYRRLITDVEQRRGLNETTGLQRTKILNIPKVFTHEIEPLYKNYISGKMDDNNNLIALRNAMKGLISQIKPEAVDAVIGFLCVKFLILSESNFEISDLKVTSKSTSSLASRLGKLLEDITLENKSSVTNAVHNLVKEYGDEAFTDDFSDTAEIKDVLKTDKPAQSIIKQLEETIQEIQRSSTSKDDTLTRYYQDIIILLKDDLAVTDSEELAKMLQKCEKDKLPDINHYVQFFKAYKKDVELASSCVSMLFKA